MVPAAFFPMLYAWVLVQLVDLNIITPGQIASMSGSPMMYAAIMGGIIISGVWIGFYTIRAARYSKRFKQRNGKICFVCDYDLIDGQSRCPECGAAWSPEGLGRRWKQHIARAAD
jgi:hypothetical protein